MVKKGVGIVKVSLFITCIADLFYPKVGQSAVNVLEKLGYEVDFPIAQTCCGQAVYNSGYKKDAIKAAKHFIKVFESKQYIVSPSGSCVGMIRKIYPKLLQNDPNWLKRAERVAEKTYEFSEFLTHIVGLDHLDFTFSARATYHASCHMTRDLGLKNDPIQVLEKVKGLELVPLSNSEDCCGFGGTFSIKHPNVSASMGDEKTEHVEKTEADMLIMSDLGCMMHLSGYANRQERSIPMMHVAEILSKGC